MDLYHPLLHPVGDFCRVGTFQHHHSATDGLLAITGQGAIAGGFAKLYGGHVFYQYRPAVTHVHHDVFNVGQCFGDAVGADVVGARVLFDVGPARILVAVFQCIKYIGDTDADGFEQVGFHGHLILFQKTAHRVDHDHALDAR